MDDEKTGHQKDTRQRSKLSFSNSRLVATFNSKVVAKTKFLVARKKKKKAGHFAFRYMKASRPNGTFANISKMFETNSLVH